MREHKLLAPDVDLADLATQTKNFTGAEIEGLVRAAQSTAMNRFIQVQRCFHTTDYSGTRRTIDTCTK